MEIKGPYKAAKEGLDPASTAKTMKNFFCKAGGTGKPELKRSRDFFHQVQGTMAIKIVVQFLVWTPTEISVEPILFDSRLSTETSLKCVSKFCRPHALY